MIKFSDNFNRVEGSYCSVLLQIRELDWEKDRKNERFASQFLSSGKLFQNTAILLRHGWRCIEQYNTRVENGVTFIQVSVRLQKLCKKLFVSEYAWVECVRDYPVAITEVVHPQKIEATFTYAKRVMLMSMLGVVGIDNDDEDGNAISLGGVDTSVFIFVEKLKAGLKSGSLTKHEVVTHIKERLNREHSPLLQNFLASLEDQKIPVLKEVVKDEAVERYAEMIACAESSEAVNDIMRMFKQDANIMSHERQKLTSISVRKCASLNGVARRTA